MIAVNVPPTILRLAGASGTCSPKKLGVADIEKYVCQVQNREKVKPTPNQCIHAGCLRSIPSIEVLTRLESQDFCEKGLDNTYSVIV